MNQAGPIDNLMTALEVVRGHAPGEVAEWLSVGLEKYIRYGQDLEESLSLKTGKPGQDKLRTQWKRWQRDEALREAFKLITVKGDWNRAELNCEKQ